MRPHFRHRGGKREGAFGADDKTVDKIEKVGEAVGTLIGDAKAPDGTEEQE